MKPVIWTVPAILVLALALAVLHVSQRHVAEVAVADSHELVRAAAAAATAVAVDMPGDSHSDAVRNTVIALVARGSIIDAPDARYELIERIALMHPPLDTSPTAFALPAPPALAALVLALPADSSNDSLAISASVPRVSQSVDPASAFELGGRVGRGHCGEVWLARRVTDGALFVLKRIFGSAGTFSHLSGLREAHFGARFHGKSHVTRFVSQFTAGSQLWLVFHHEGVSLAHYFHSVDESGAQQPSAQWAQMRSEHGQHVFRSLLRQSLMALALVHGAGVTHRDIKPANLLLKLNPAHAFHSDMPQPYATHFHTSDYTAANTDSDSIGELRVADFGSAVELDSAQTEQLYSTGAPSMAECTADYASPEALFLTDVLFTPAYDVFSLGVSMLELWLGGLERVFALDSRTVARVHASLGDADQRAKDRAVKMRAFIEYCVYIDSNSDSGECDESRLRQRYRAADPLGTGFDDAPLLFDLLRQLLRWSPTDRLTPVQALEHPFFAQSLGLSRDRASARIRAVQGGGEGWPLDKRGAQPRAVQQRAAV